MIGKLGYNDENNRFGILVGDLWKNDGLHCGETLKVFLNDKWEFDRLEYKNNSWYLFYSGLIGEELEGLKVEYK